MARSSPEWNLDSDEIASVTSQDLHDNRPNRWAGRASTWREFTKEERHLWRSMKQLEDRDLAIHLYNAHALKRRGRDPATAQDVTVTMDNGQQGIWAPPNVWTAWPLGVDRLPDDKAAREQDIYGNRGDGEDDAVYRLQEKTMPSSDLQEELSATVLRLAKERFYRERVSPTGESDTEAPGEDSDGDGDGDESRLGASNIEMDIESGEENTQAKPSQAGRSSKTRGRKRTFVPVPSTDDDRSYQLLRQPVRHILTQVDNTLRVLHNARVATADYASDSSATSDESDSQPGTPRRRGRPRGVYRHSNDNDDSNNINNNGNSSASQTDTTGGRRRGRPRKVHVPREGESREDMLVRVARESHRRLPATSADKDAAFEAWLRAGDEQGLPPEGSEPGGPASASASASVAASASVSAPASPHPRKRGRRLGLRTWCDVVGAAALAGFPAHVIARTTRRCAALFGEAMTIRQLHEAPPSGRQPAFQSVDYHPEPIHLFDDADADAADDDDDYADGEDEDERPSDRGSEFSQRSSRQPSADPRRGRATASPSAIHSRSQSQSQSQNHSRSHSQSRSRSRSSAGCHLCPIPTCERAVTGFSRRHNLRRHMRLVHPGQEGEEEQDSEDEVLGAVHVDGFLRPILPSRGWREMRSPRARGGAAGSGFRGSVSVSPRPLPPPVSSLTWRAPQRSPSFSLSEDD